MTREETVKNLLSELIDMIDNGSQRDLDRADEISDFIIKLLAQEPCEDCVSREEAYEALNSINGGAELDRVFEAIENLPSVTPQEPNTDLLDKIKSYIEHIKITGMGKAKSLEFIEKFIEGLKTERVGNKMKNDLTTYQIYLMLLGYLTEHDAKILEPILTELYMRAESEDKESEG